MKSQAVLSIPDKSRIRAIALYATVATFFFTVIYSQCNHLATLSSTHYSLYTDWELKIPLVPWMIYPYVSLNLLFIFAAFVLKEESSIKGLCLSLSAAAVIAGIIFYFFPGKLGFVRESVSGYEDYFNFMFSIDQPHNLFPSLHVTYSSLVIGAMYEQTYNKKFHFFLYAWLMFIIASVVLVHQHHLFDIFTGLVLAFLLYKFVYLKLHRTSRTTV